MGPAKEERPAVSRTKPRGAVRLVLEAVVRERITITLEMQQPKVKPKMAEKTACPNMCGKKSLLMIETELRTMTETVKLTA